MKEAIEGELKFNFMDKCVNGLVCMLLSKEKHYKMFMGVGKKRF